MSSTSCPFRIGLVREPSADPATATALAAELALPLISEASAPGLTHLLVLTSVRLELRELGSNAAGPVYVDFAAGAAAHRRRFGGGRNQPLARAVGVKGSNVPTVIDATAGLGRDAFILAVLGCTVRLVEREPIIAALLRDGLQRAVRAPDIGPLVSERLSLIVADGRTYLRELPESQRPDVVFLDPMYPPRRKAALSGKAMRLLRRLAGDDDDAPELLVAALACVRRRVVVKRPRLAPPLAGPPPGFKIVAPNTRFDVYPVNRPA